MVKPAAKREGVKHLRQTYEVGLQDADSADEAAGLHRQPQAHLPDLLRGEPAGSGAPETQARAVARGRNSGTRASRPALVDGLHERPAGRRAAHPHTRHHRRSASALVANFNRRLRPVSESFALMFSTHFWDCLSLVISSCPTLGITPIWPSIGHFSRRNLRSTIVSC